MNEKIMNKSKTTKLCWICRYSNSILSQPIEFILLATDKIKIENITNRGALNLLIKYLLLLFMLLLNQLLDSRHYNNNSFYVSGSESVLI